MVRLKETAMLGKKILSLVLFSSILLMSAAFGEQPDAEVMALVKKGHDLFRAEMYKEAMDAFDAALAADPSSDTALAYRREYSNFLLLLLTKRECEQQVEIDGKTVTKKYDFSKIAQRLLDKAADSELLEYSDEAVQKLVDEQYVGTGMETDIKKELDALNRMLFAGDLCVPYLIPYLQNEGEERKRAQAIMALRHIKKRAVLPLLECLDSASPVFKQVVIKILEGIQDERAVPRLVEIMKNPGQENPAVVGAAIKALQTITGLDERSFGDPEDYYYDLANRYFHDSKLWVEPSYRREKMRVVWQWDHAGGKLVKRHCLKFEYNEQLAIDLIYRGLAVAPDSEKLTMLLCSTLVQQYREALNLKNVVDQTKNDPRVADDAPQREYFIGRQELEVLGAEIEKRIAELEVNVAIYNALGKRAAYTALEKSLAESNTENSVALIKLLEKLEDGENLTSRTAVAGTGETEVTGGIREYFIPIDPQGNVIRHVAGKRLSKMNNAYVSKPTLNELAAEIARSYSDNVELVRETAKYYPEIRKFLHDIMPAEYARYFPGAVDFGQIDIKKTVELFDGNVNPLIQALDNPDKRVRYEAAAAILKINPKQQFDAAAQVVGVARDAVSEAGIRTILLISEDGDLRNTYLESVIEDNQKRYFCQVAFDGNDGWFKAARFPTDDMIVIDESLTRNKRRDELARMLKKNANTAGIPIVYITSKNDVDAVRAKYTAQDNLIVDTWDREMKGKQLLARLDKAFTDFVKVSETKMRKNEYAMQAAEALRSLDVKHTVFDLQPIVDDLHASFKIHDEEINIVVMDVLGNIGNKASIEPLISQIREKVLNTKAGRLAAIRNLTKVIRANSILINQALWQELNSVMLENDIDLKKAAGAAMGAGVVDAHLRLKMLRQQKLDKPVGVPTEIEPAEPAPTPEAEKEDEPAGEGEAAAEDEE